MNETVAFVKRYWILLGVLVVFLFAISVFCVGYRFGAGFALVRNGTLVVNNLPSGTVLYTDAIREAKSKNGTVRIALSPGAHTVIIEAPGMQPWSELFDIKESAPTILVPFLIPTEVNVRTLTGEEKQRADHLIWNERFPTSLHPLPIAGGCAQVRVDGSTIIAEPSEGSDCAPTYLCDATLCTPIIVYQALEQVRSVLAYPGRDDAVIIATGGLLYVVELDPREPQFTAPLWKGSLAFAAPWSDTAVVVTNGSETLEVTLPQP